MASTAAEGMLPSAQPAAAASASAAGGAGTAQQWQMWPVQPAAPAGVAISCSGTFVGLTLSALQLALHLQPRGQGAAPHCPAAGGHIMTMPDLWVPLHPHPGGVMASVPSQQRGSTAR